jgi:hypothetical protein
MTDDPLGPSLTALAQVPVPLTWDDVERRLRTPTPSPPHGPRRRRLLVAAALVAVAAVALGAFLLWPRPEPGSVTTISEPPADGSTTTTSPATRTSRTNPVTAVAGDQYLVWAGEAGAPDISARADGFAVDLASGSVSPIPVAPIDPRSGAAGVWTGTELIVCCGIGRADGFPFDTRSAAAWDPATGEWRVLPPPPEGIARGYPAAVWTGEVMVVATEGAAATYDPGAGAWAEIPAPPLPDGGLPEAVWTGDEMVVWNPVYGSGRVPPDGAVADQGWRWALGDPAWTPLPDLPEGARTQLGSMGWTGTEVVVWGESTAEDGMGVGARWRPGDDGWRPLAPSPQGQVDHYDGTPGSQAVVSDPDRGRVLVVGLDPAHGGLSPVYAYDPATDRWAETGAAVPGFHPHLDSAGDRLLAPDEAAPVAGRV